LIKKHAYPSGALVPALLSFTPITEKKKCQNGWCSQSLQEGVWAR
jgi:hypothetical protein